MKTHASQFSSHIIRQTRNVALGLDENAGVAGKCPNASAKVHEGKMNANEKHLSPKLLDELDAKWQSVMKPITGYDSYEDMRAGINQELGRTFGT